MPVYSLREDAPHLVSGLADLGEAIADAHDGDEVLLGDQAADDADRGLPGAEAERDEDERDRAADGGRMELLLSATMPNAPFSTPKACRNQMMMELSSMTVPARLMKLQPRSQVARRTLLAAGAW